MNTFGERLAYIRKKRDLYQYEAAEKLGVHRVTYSNYEQNTREMDYATIARVCKLLDVTSDFLLGISSSPRSVDKYTNEEMTYMLKSLEVFKEVKRNFK